MPSSIESVVAAVGSFLPAETSASIRKNVKRSVQAALEDMDFVTRSELEVQETVLRRAREKIKELEERVKVLEAEAQNRTSASE